MSTGRRRLSSVLFFSLTILLASGIFGLLYFVQIQQNEDYQNQLHFRELNEIGTGLSDAIRQLSSVANVPKDPLTTALDIIEALNKENISLSENIEQADADNIQKTYNQLWEAEDEIDVKVIEYLESVLIGFDDSQIAGLVVEYCDTNEEHQYCRYFSDIYEELIYDQYWWESFYSSEKSTFSAEQLASWNQRYLAIQQGLIAQRDTIDQITVIADSAKNAVPEERLKLTQQAVHLCSKSKAIWCDALDIQSPASIQKSNLKASPKAPAQFVSLHSSFLEQFVQQRTRLVEFNRQQEYLLNQFSKAWKALTSVLNHPTNQQPITELTSLSNAVQEALALNSKLEADESTSADPMQSLWKEARDSAIASIESLSNQFLGRKSDDNLYTRAAKKIENNIARVKPIDEPERAKLNNFINQFRADYVPTLKQIQLRQRVRLANGGDTLSNLVLSQTKNSSALTTEKQKPTPSDVVIQDPCTLKSNDNTKMDLGFFRQYVKAGIKDLCFSVPTQDLLAKNLDRFPLIMVADSRGEVMARATSLSRSVEPADLQFNQAKGLFNALITKQGLGDTATPHFSGILEQEIGGIVYKIFIQPVNIPLALKDNQQLFLIGLVPLDELRFAKLSVSPSTALWFVLGVVALMAAVPLIKIRFVSLRYSYSRADISQLGLGFVILAGVLSIGISDQLFFSYFQQSKSEQANQLFYQIKDEFADELDTILNYRPLVTGSLTDEDVQCIKRFNSSNPVRSQTQGSDYVYFQNCDNSNLQIKIQDENNNEKLFYLLEGSFSLDARGLFNTSGESSMMLVDTLAPARWLHSGLYIANDINLSHRNYFKDAMACEYPYQASDQACHQGFAIDRIANVRDGRKSTQFGFSEFESLHETATSKRTISSIGTRLRTFLSRVMPNNFGYMVFDTSGKVLYHSEDERALLENIFVETNNNAQLRTLVNHRQAGEKPVTFETLYRDQEHLFLTAQLHPQLPWYVVIYHSQSPTLNTNMLLVFISISLFIVIIAPLFLWSRYATDQNVWRRWLVYSPEHARLYSRFGWWSTGIVLFSLLSMGFVHALSIRLTLWLVLVIVLIFRLNIRFMPTELRRLSATHPVVPFCIAGALMFAISLTEFAHFGWDNTLANYIALIATILTLVGLVCFGWWHSKRPIKKLSNRRYPRSYIWYIVSLLWLFAVVPALLVVNSANRYLLHHQAHLDSAHLLSANGEYEKQVASYLELMNIKNHERYQRTPWLNQESLTLMYPAAIQRNPVTWLDTFQNSLAWVDITNKDEPIQPVDHADNIISKLVSLADVGGSINAELHYLAKSSGENHSNELVVHYDADKFLLSATFSQFGLILIIQILLLLGAYKIVRVLLVQRIMGEHLPANFRQNDTAKLDQKLAWFEANFKRLKHLRVQLIRSTPARARDLFTHRLKTAIYKNRVLNIQECLAVKDNQFNVLSDLKDELEGGTVNLLLSGLDDLAFHRSQRKQALTLLSQLHELNGLNIILLCEVAPLFRLCKPEAYPGIDESELSDQAEMLAWANLLANFDKEYDWSPSSKEQLPVNPSATQILTYEQDGWPQLASVADIFARYHAGIKCMPSEQSYAKKLIDKYWEQDQVIEFFASHAGALYRQKWQQCTKDEKLLLYQVATGDAVNPNNVEVIEHLVRRGYLYRDQGWHLINLSFKRFILTAENEADMAEWQAEAKNSVWQLLKMPIMVVVLVLVALILLGTGEGLESILGILSAMLGLIPLLLRNIGAFGQASGLNS